MHIAMQHIKYLAGFHRPDRKLRGCLCKITLHREHDLVLPVIPERDLFRAAFKIYFYQALFDKSEFVADRALLQPDLCLAQGFLPDATQQGRLRFRGYGVNGIEVMKKRKHSYSLKVSDIDTDG